MIPKDCRVPGVHTDYEKTSPVFYKLMLQAGEVNCAGVVHAVLKRIIPNMT